VTITKPIYPLTEKEEMDLMEHDDSHSSQYESLAEWKSEVAQFGDASFSQPKIQPLVYEGRLKVLKDKLTEWSKNFAEWENKQWEINKDFVDENIPF